MAAVKHPTTDLRVKMRVRTRFLGLDFDPMTRVAAVSCLDRTASATEPFTYVVTPNVDHIVQLDQESSLRSLYSDARIVLNDSRILELIARMSGKTFPASPGADVVAALFQSTIEPGEPVTIIGLSQESVTTLKQKFGLRTVNWHDAPMGLRQNPEAIADAARFIISHPARFHFICVGAPQQEMIAWTAKQMGGGKGIGLCCGASLDFLSGKTARAPEWMRRARLEWLHRLVTDPKRLASRYLRGGPAIARIWWQHRGE